MHHFNWCDSPSWPVSIATHALINFVIFLCIFFFFFTEPQPDYDLFIFAMEIRAYFPCAFRLKELLIWTVFYLHEKNFSPKKKKTNKNYVEGKHQHESSEMFGWKLLGGHGAPHEREKQRRANYPSEKQSPICLRETKGKNCAHAHTNASKLITSKIYRMNNQTARLSNALSTRFRKKRKKKTNKIIISM